MQEVQAPAALPCTAFALQTCPQMNGELSLAGDCEALRQVLIESSQRGVIQHLPGSHPECAQELRPPPLPSSVPQSTHRHPSPAKACSLISSVTKARQACSCHCSRGCKKLLSHHAYYQDAKL